MHRLGAFLVQCPQPLDPGVDFRPHARQFCLDADPLGHGLLPRGLQLRQRCAGCHALLQEHGLPCTEFRLHERQPRHRGLGGEHPGVRRLALQLQRVLPVANRGIRVPGGNDRGAGGLPRQLRGSALVT